MTPMELVGLTPGCSVWDAASDQDPELPIHGGIVYATTRMKVEDELVDLYLYAEPYRASYRTGSMTGPEVRQWQLPNMASVRYLVRQCCRHVYTSKGALDSADLTAIEIAHHLTHLERPT